MSDLSPYLALALASWHVDPAIPFQEINPGIGIVRPVGGAELEAGIYYNSYADLSLYAVASAETPGDLRAGVFAGVATYRRGSMAEALPTLPIGRTTDVVPIFGLQASADLGSDLGVRVRLAPGDGDAARAVFTLQLLVYP